MKNYILTFVLGILVVLTSVSLRHMIASNSVSASSAATLVAIGPGPVPLPQSRVAIGPGPVPLPPSR
jgi:hypothetical protein